MEVRQGDAEGQRVHIVARIDHMTGERERERDESVGERSCEESPLPRVSPFPLLDAPTQCTGQSIISPVRHETVIYLRHWVFHPKPGYNSNSPVAKHALKDFEI